MAELRFRTVPSLGAIAADDWNTCANPARCTLDIPRSRFETPDVQPAAAPCPPAPAAPGYNPFLSYAFFDALERSGSVGPQAGWLPQYLIAETAAGAIAGVVPAYVKSHSRGEYVFDHGWADALERAGGDYYPKLQVAVPFTPATGPRLLARPGPDAAATRAALAEALIALCRQIGTSSVHITFMPQQEWQIAGTQGYLLRTDQQFHWQNDGYRSFDDFLAALSSRKRKTIRRERREALASGIEIDWLTGRDLTETVWDQFFDFYMETGSRKWGRPYLTRQFYSLIGATMADDIVLMMARRAGRYIAGAINFRGADTLFGRHWGAVEHHPFLHFELCYYQAIDYAIAHGLPRVEAGAQGEHKLARGYLPSTTYSAHYIAHPALRRAVADYLARERHHVEAAARELTAAAPFRKADPETGD